MTNKREIKKYIHRVGGEIAQYLLPGAVVTNAITEDKAEEILTELSRLEAQALSRVGVAYDKAPSSFDSPTAYNKARRQYYQAAYGKLLDEYHKGVNVLLGQINPDKA